jgi:hypothetical protein
MRREKKVAFQKKRNEKKRHLTRREDIKETFSSETKRISKSYFV